MCKGGNIVFFAWVLTDLYYWLHRRDWKQYLLRRQVVAFQWENSSYILDFYHTENGFRNITVLIVRQYKDFTLRSKIATRSKLRFKLELWFNWMGIVLFMGSPTRADPGHVCIDEVRESSLLSSPVRLTTTSTISLTRCCPSLGLPLSRGVRLAWRGNK